MTFKFTRCIQTLFLSLVASLLIKTKAPALENKKTSTTLSHYIMAVMYDELGQIDDSIVEYKRALKTDYNNTVIHLNLASSFIKKNDFESAIEELKLAIKFDPEAVEPHAILALLYSTQNQVDLATAEYEIALKNASKQEPKNIDIYKSLGAIYLKQKKFEAARDAYKLILDLSPNDNEAHFYLGNIYDELNLRDLAIEELRLAIQRKPDYHEALNYLGYIYVEENKNLDEAQILIRKALEIEPDNGAYIDSLGWLYFKQANFKEAIEELEKASSLLKDPVIYDHLGDAYFKINNFENAKLNWQRALELDPHQDKVKKKLEELNKSK